MNSSNANSNDQFVKNFHSVCVLNLVFTVCVLQFRQVN